jgi:CRP/FNR family cyclic AMP-dependent transcriptional regulator
VRNQYINENGLGMTRTSKRGPAQKRRKTAVAPQSLSADLSAGSNRDSLTGFDENAIIFRQDDPAASLFNIHKGKVKLTVVSKSGKEAVIAVLGAGDFFGEGCLAGQQRRMSTATALTECSVERMEKGTVLEKLRKDSVFADLLLSYTLTRTIRIEEDLIDQLFNSSEKRLARALLLLANFGKEGKPETVIPKISQETLADMIGTTRSRVSFFMNKFRRLGFIQYNGTLEVHSSLLNVILHD